MKNMILSPGHNGDGSFDRTVRNHAYFLQVFIISIKHSKIDENLANKKSWTSGTRSAQSRAFKTSILTISKQFTLLDLFSINFLDFSKDYFCSPPDPKFVLRLKNVFLQVIDFVSFFIFYMFLYLYLYLYLFTFIYIFIYFYFYIFQTP